MSFSLFQMGCPFIWRDLSNDFIIIYLFELIFNGIPFKTYKHRHYLIFECETKIVSLGKDWDSWLFLIMLEKISLPKLINIKMVVSLPFQPIPLKGEKYYQLIITFYLKICHLLISKNVSSSTSHKKLPSLRLFGG